MKVDAFNKANSIEMIIFARIEFCVCSCADDGTRLRAS